METIFQSKLAGSKTNLLIILFVVFFVFTAFLALYYLTQDVAFLFFAAFMLFLAVSLTLSRFGVLDAKFKISRDGLIVVAHPLTSTWPFSDNPNTFFRGTKMAWKINISKENISQASVLPASDKLDEEFSKSCSIFNKTLADEIKFAFYRKGMPCLRLVAKTIWYRHLLLSKEFKDVEILISVQNPSLALAKLKALGVHV